MLTRFERTAYRRRWAVLGGWVVVLVGLVVLNATVGGKYLDRFELPGSESQAATDLLASHGFDARTGASGQLVFRADDVSDPQVRAGIEDLLARIDRAIAPGEVVSPYTPQGAANVNADHTIAYAEINMGDRDSDQYPAVGREVRALVDRAHVPDTTIELGR